MACYMWFCFDISVVFNCSIGHFCRFIWLNRKSEHSEYLLLQSAAPGSLKPFAHGRWWTGCLTLPMSFFVQPDMSQHCRLMHSHSSIPLWIWLTLVPGLLFFNITGWGRWACSGGLSYFLCLVLGLYFIKLLHPKSPLHYSDSALLSSMNH